MSTEDGRRTGRVAYVAVGWCFFGLGVAGAFLPVLPTTPLMLLALWAFARGSPRLHRWLYEHPRFGPSLRRWHEHRVIPPRAKAGAIAAMLASLAYLVFFSPAPPAAVAGAAALIAVGAAYVLRQPSHPPPGDPGR